jgi:RHS repeat-associated protein
MSELDYTYDQVDNRTSTTETFNADGKGPDEVSKDTYQYDATYQVTGVNYGAPDKGGKEDGKGKGSGKSDDDDAVEVRYSYDAVGNRVQVSQDGAVTRYAVNALNQYTQVGEFKPTYDRNGDLAGQKEWLYRYDAMNRLLSASDGRTTARFFYDAKNRCVARSYQTPNAQPSTATGQLTLNYYDGWNLIEERDAAGKQLARYVHGRRIDEIVVMVNRLGIFYPHRDVQGSVTMLTDAAGKLVERYKYSVEGKVAISDAKGRLLERSAVGNRWMYTGREWLAEVGLYDYRNRVYSAFAGRFLQLDRLRFQGNDINMYRCTGNNFANLVDPFGDEATIVYVATGDLATDQLTVGVMRDQILAKDECGDGTSIVVVGSAGEANAYANNNASEDNQIYVAAHAEGAERGQALGFGVDGDGRVSRAGT